MDSLLIDFFSNKKNTLGKDFYQVFVTNVKEDKI